MAGHAGSVARLKGRQQALEEAISCLPPCSVTPDCRARLLKLVRAEGRFVERLALQDLAVSCARLSSTNFTHLEAVVEILKHPSVTGASGVMLNFCAYAPRQAANLVNRENYITAHVDLVCSFDGKPVWMVTSMRNPKYISWGDDGSKKGLRSKVLSLLIVACEDVVVQPAFILLCFAGTLKAPVAENLESDFQAVKVGSRSQRKAPVGFSQEDSRLYIDCSLDDDEDEDEDDDWVEIIKHKETGEPMEDVVTAKSDRSQSWTAGFSYAWTTYLVRVSRVRLSALLLGVDIVPQRAVQLDKHVCSNDYAGHGESTETDHMDVTAAPVSVVWSEEDNTSRGIQRDSKSSSLAQTLSDLQLSMRQLGGQHSLKDIDAKGLVNLDTTALIAWVSQLSNGGAFAFSRMSSCDLQDRFGNMWTFIRDQAQSELGSPLMPEIEAVLAAGVPVVSQFAVDEFQSIVSTVGGPQEKQRSQDLLKRLQVFPNRPSVRVMALEETGKIKERHKIIFGTGDFWHAPTLTANMSFVRAARNTGMALAAIEHRPRALTGD